MAFYSSSIYPLFYPITPAPFFTKFIEFIYTQSQSDCHAKAKSA